MVGFPPKGAQCVEIPEGLGRTTYPEAAGHQVATNTFQLCAAPLPLTAESHLQLFVVIHMENENKNICLFFWCEGSSTTVPVGYKGPRASDLGHPVSILYLIVRPVEPPWPAPPKVDESPEKQRSLTCLRCFYLCKRRPALEEPEASGTGRPRICGMACHLTRGLGHWEPQGLWHSLSPDCDLAMKAVTFFPPTQHRALNCLL